jgi:multiple sugar transport system substrate-binding protein
VKKVTKDTDGDKIIDQFGVVDFTWQDIVYTNGQTLFSQDGKKAEFYKEGVVEAIAFAKKLYRLNNNTKVTIGRILQGM